MSTCPFCPPTRERLVESDRTVAFADGYPVSQGHTLVVPKRHTASYFELTDGEKQAIWQLVDVVKDLLTVRHNPDGFNVGLNDGTAAGQTVMHCHIHVIPRYDGDVDVPRGGVRHAVIGKGYYDPDQ